MSKIKSIKSGVMAQHAHGEKLKRVHVISKRDKLFSVNDMFTIVEDIKANIVKQSPNASKYELCVVPHDDNHKIGGGWYIGKWNGLIEKGFYIWNPQKYTFVELMTSINKGEFYEEDKFDQFYIQIKKIKSTAFEHSVFNKVGNSKNNDCVFEFLESLYIPVPFTRESLKKFCGVSRKEKINLSDFKKIENHIKYKDCRFLVTSDNISNCYISDKTDFKYTFNAINKDGHLIGSNIYDNHNIIISETDKDICMYSDSLITDDKVTLYNKKGYYTIKTHAFFPLLKHDANKSKQLFVRVKSDELHDEYKQYMTDANIIKKESNGNINLFRTGSYYTTMLNLLYKYTSHIKFDALPLMEQLFLHYSYIGAIMTAKTDYVGQCYKYDIRSFYGYIMSSHKNQYPFKSGAFIQLSKDDFESLEFYKFGVYRCSISGECKHFVFNKNNYYTHVDLEIAKRYNLKIDIIIDGQPNFLYYDKSCLTSGYHLFKPLITQLYNIKMKFPECKTIKTLLTLVSGLLGERVKKTNIVSIDEDLDVSNYENLVVVPTGKDDKIKYVGIDISDKIFKHDYARCSPFINSYSRREVLNQIGSENLKNIVRIQTDGWMLSEKPKVDYVFGENMGEIKFEGYYKNIRINNLNNIDNLEDGSKLVGKVKNKDCDLFEFID